MPKHKLPAGFNDRIRAREEAKRQRTADSPPSTAEAIEKKTLKDCRARTEEITDKIKLKTEQQGRAELLLENLDKDQLLALLQASDARGWC